MTLYLLDIGQAGVLVKREVPRAEEGIGEGGAIDGVGGV